MGALGLFGHRDSDADVLAVSGSRLGSNRGSSDERRTAVAVMLAGSLVEHRVVYPSPSSGLVTDLVVQRIRGQHVGSGLDSG